MDLERGRIEVKGKTGSRAVPLPPHLVAELRDWIPGETDWWGVRPGTIRRQTTLYVRATCGAADVPVWTPHGLRRLAVDTLARSGVDVATAASLLGHTPEIMLQAYRQVSESDRRAAVLQARLGRAPEGQVIQLRNRSD